MSTAGADVTGALEHRRELALHARERLAAALERCLGERRRAGDEQGPVRVSVHSLLERCPRRLANPADDYVDTAATVRRRLGLRALRRAAEGDDPGSGRSTRLPVGEAVTAALGERADWPTGLRQWFEELDRAGRASVRAAVTTWCVDALRLVGTDDRVRWADPFVVSRADVPGRAVQLRGGADAVIGTPRTGEKLLVLSDAVPGPEDRLRAGHLAVVHALGSGRAPVRVTIGSPSIGELRPVPVERDLLELAVDRIAEAAGHLAEPGTAPTVPGRWCRHCHWLQVCDDGAAALAVAAG